MKLTLLNTFLVWLRTGWGRKSSQNFLSTEATKSAALVSTASTFVEMTTVTVIPTSNTEFPLDAEGRVYHIGAKRGEIANRVLLVGDPNRADLIAKAWLDTNENVFYRTSTRGFTWYTGKYKGTPVTIMAIGMGLSMMDFAVREMRALVDGEMVMIRLGTAGSPHKDCKPGSMVVSTETVRIEQNLNSVDYDHPHKEVNWKDGYLISKPAPASASLTNELVSALGKFAVSAKNVVTGISASAESFYSSQGRVDINFADFNHELVDGVISVHPGMICFEMETHQLYHLAKTCRKPISASACAIVLMQRKSHEIIDHETKVALEKEAGQAILETLNHHAIDDSQIFDDASCVWNHPKA
jgi:uridine phosphorylase